MLTYLAAAAAIILMLWSGYLNVQSYLIGIYTKLDVHAADIRDMTKYYEQYYGRIEGLRNFEDFKSYEKDRVRYEIKVLKSIEPFIEALDRAKQTK